MYLQGFGYRCLIVILFQLKKMLYLPHSSFLHLNLSESRFRMCGAESVCMRVHAGEQADGVNDLSTLNAVREAVVWCISFTVVIYIRPNAPTRRLTSRRREMTSGNREKEIGSSDTDVGGGWRDRRADDSRNDHNKTKTRLITPRGSSVRKKIHNMRLCV